MTVFIGRRVRLTAILVVTFLPIDIPYPIPAQEFGANVLANVAIVSGLGRRVTRPVVGLQRSVADPLSPRSRYHHPDRSQRRLSVMRAFKTRLSSADWR